MDSTATVVAGLLFSAFYCFSQGRGILCRCRNCRGRFLLQGKLVPSSVQAVARRDVLIAELPLPLMMDVDVTTFM